MDTSKSPLPEDLFDADWYTGKYEDVRKALGTGQLKSAYEHYSRHGYAENRYASAADARGEVQRPAIETPPADAVPAAETGAAADATAADAQRSDFEIRPGSLIIEQRAAKKPAKKGFFSFFKK